MYDRMYNMKFLPPGRGLWAAGSPLTEERNIYAALFNCAFVSTADLYLDKTGPFEFMMDMSMLGCGVGFDVDGAGSFLIKGFSEYAETSVIKDTRESWVESVGNLLLNGFTGGPNIEFDYSLIRPEGTPIKGFGGLASGPDPLIKLHNQIRDNITKLKGSYITETFIADVMNQIGACVVAGNVRRTAQISLGNTDSQEYLKLKDYKWTGSKYEGNNAHRAEYGWASNNSVYANSNSDYAALGQQTALNGEPGYFWLDNTQKYGRMSDPINFKDYRVKGTNPCCEQSLESFEMCCLVETFPAKHDSLEDYLKTLKYAYLYAKTVTLTKTHWAKTNAIMLRNRRIGCSMSGIQQAISNLGLDTFKTWCNAGYDKIQQYDKTYSEWFCIPQSIKTTSVKPSGTVSLLNGSTPGMHWPESRYYIRRMRLSKNSDLVGPLKKAGYKVEPCVGQEDSTVVVEFPVSLGNNIRTVSEVSMWEQLEVAAFLQAYWADNQVSATITFQPHEAKDIPRALEHFQYRLKGVSFLPQLEEAAYAQMPYEAITETEYNKMSKSIKPVAINNLSEEVTEHEPGCESGVCEIRL